MCVLADIALSAIKVPGVQLLRTLYIFTLSAPGTDVQVRVIWFPLQVLLISASAIFAHAELCVVHVPREEQANHSAYSHPCNLKQISGPDNSHNSPLVAIGTTTA